MKVPVLARRVLSACALLSVGAWAVPCVSQQPGTDVDTKVSYFLDRSYIFYDVPAADLVPADRTLLFEAQIAPNFFLYQNFNDKARDVFAGDRWRTAFSAAITPMIRLRQTASWSDPVRTPSYMPKATLQLFLLHPRASTREGLHRAWVVIVQTVVGHHSNGQNGCLYEGYSRQPSGADTVCVPDPGTDTLHNRVNRIDGSFSTNYLQFGVFAKAVGLDSMNEFKKSWGGGLQLEINPTGSFGIDPLIREIYGRTRLKALVEYVDSMPRNPFTHRRLPGRGRVEASMEHIFGAPPQVSSNKLMLEADWGFPQSSNWLGGYGVFVRYYRGQDYYNLGFLTQVSVLQFGMVVDQGRFGSFPLPRLPPPRNGP